MTIQCNLNNLVTLSNTPEQYNRSVNRINKDICLIGNEFQAALDCSNACYDSYTTAVTNFCSCTCDLYNELNAIDGLLQAWRNYTPVYHSRLIQFTLQGIVCTDIDQDTCQETGWCAYLIAKCIAYACQNDGGFTPTLTATSLCNNYYIYCRTPMTFNLPHSCSSPLNNMACFNANMVLGYWDNNGTKCPGTVTFSTNTVIDVSALLPTSICCFVNFNYDAPGYCCSCDFLNRYCSHTGYNFTSAIKVTRKHQWVTST